MYLLSQNQYYIVLSTKVQHGQGKSQKIYGKKLEIKRNHQHKLTLSNQAILLIKRWEQKLNFRENSPKKNLSRDLRDGASRKGLRVVYLFIYLFSQHAHWTQKKHSSKLVPLALLIQPVILQAKQVVPVEHVGLEYMAHLIP